MIVCAALALALAVAVEDARSCRIRNSICLAMAALGLAFQAVRIWVPELSGVLAFHLADETSAPQAVLAAALLVLFCGAALELAWRRIHGASGMGLGDIKYIAAWATLLGPGIFVRQRLWAPWSRSFRRRSALPSDPIFRPHSPACLCSCPQASSDALF